MTHSERIAFWEGLFQMGRGSCPKSWRFAKPDQFDQPDVAIQHHTVVPGTMVVLRP
jgi:hypothetical protein